MIPIRITETESEQNKPKSKKIWRKRSQNEKFQQNSTKWIILESKTLCNEFWKFCITFAWMPFGLHNFCRVCCWCVFVVFSMCFEIRMWFFFHFSRVFFSSLSFGVLPQNTFDSFCWVSVFFFLHSHITCIRFQRLCHCIYQNHRKFSA